MLSRPEASEVDGLRLRRWLAGMREEVAVGVAPVGGRPDGCRNVIPPSSCCVPPAVFSEWERCWPACGPCACCCCWICCC